MDTKARPPDGLGVTRRRLIGAASGLAFLAAARPALAQATGIIDPMERRTAKMEIKRNGSRPCAKGPEAYFTGAVRVDPVFQVGDPLRLSAATVTFEPGARTAWHT